MFTENKISLYANYQDTEPAENIPFWGFCEAVRNCDYSEEINAIRDEENKEKRDELKKALPAVTISGVFSRHKGDCLIQHSGLICLDFDAKDNPDIKEFRELREMLSRVNNVCFAALSASGRGCFAVVPIAFPERHKEHFQALQQDFASLGLTIDKGCGDVNRLRFMTSDRGAYFNADAVVYHRLYIPKRVKHTGGRRMRGSAARLIEKVIKQGVDITSSYANWYQVGASLAATFDEGGRDYFHQLSQLYINYDVRECDRQYDNCLKHPGNYSQATLFHYAKQYGITI